MPPGHDAAGLAERDGGGRRPERDRDAAQPAVGPKPLRPVLGEGAAAARFQDRLAWRSTPLAERFFPSSKTCSAGGTVNAKRFLAERVSRCEGCGLVIDREVGATRSLLQLAVRASGAGHVGMGAGSRRRPGPQGTDPVGFSGPAGKTGTDHQGSPRGWLCGVPCHRAIGGGGS
jgi:hypothetical protein